MALESPVVVLGFQDVVDDACKFFGTDGTGNALVGPTKQAFVERPDLRIVLDGMNSTVTEGHLEILVAVFVS